MNLWSQPEKCTGGKSKWRISCTFFLHIFTLKILKINYILFPTQPILAADTPGNAELQTFLTLIYKPLCLSILTKQKGFVAFPVFELCSGWTSEICCSWCQGENFLCVKWTKNDFAWCNFVKQFDGFWRFSVILEASLSVRVFDFDVHIFRAQSEFILSPLLLSLVIWSAARISQGLLFMKCRANLNLSSKLRLSCALSLFPLHLVDLQVSIFPSWVV